MNFVTCIITHVQYKLYDFKKTYSLYLPTLTHYAWFNSTCYHPPPGTPPGICVLDVLLPTPGHTARDNSPPPGLMTWTKNKLLRFDDLFLYLNKTRNLKNPKLLEQLTPFRSKANIIKLDTHTNTPGGRFNQTASKLKCISTKQLLNS